MFSLHWARTLFHVRIGDQFLTAWYEFTEKKFAGTRNALGAKRKIRTMAAGADGSSRSHTCPLVALQDSTDVELAALFVEEHLARTPASAAVHDACVHKRHYRAHVVQQFYLSLLNPALQLTRENISCTANISPACWIDLSVVK